MTAPLRLWQNLVAALYTALPAFVKTMMGDWVDVPSARVAVDVRLARLDDVSPCKRIADSHRGELGFLPRAVFAEAIAKFCLLVAETRDGRVIGFVRFNHRVRGPESALYDICVDRSFQRMGVGRALVSSLITDCQIADRSSIVLRCPEGAAANDFYARLGFRQCDIKSGRRRRLIEWRLAVEERKWNS